MNKEDQNIYSHRYVPNTGEILKNVTSTEVVKKISTGLLCNREILQIQQYTEMIKPFAKEEVTRVDLAGGGHAGIVGYGLSVGSYDIRLGCQFKRPRFVPASQLEDVHVLDPHDPREKIESLMDSFQTKLHERVIIPPKGFILGVSLETFNIPSLFQGKSITAMLSCKSSYARLGMNMTPTTLKSGWSGELVLEIFNQSNLPIAIYPGEGIGTLHFFASEFTGSYRGKYQNQKGVTLPCHK